MTKSILISKKELIEALKAELGESISVEIDGDSLVVIDDDEPIYTEEVICALQNHYGKDIKRVKTLHNERVYLFKLML